jgi:preprotein translocase subunit SecG
MLETFISIIIMLASVLLIFVVFIQNPKGGGLSSDFGAAQQIGGVQKTNDFIDKATWSLAGIIMVFSIIITIQKKSISKIAPKEAAPTEQSQGGNPVNPAVSPQPAKQQ